MVNYYLIVHLLFFTLLLYYKFYKKLKKIRMAQVNRVDNPPPNLIHKEIESVLTWDLPLSKLALQLLHPLR